jgi:hypothetical protein
VKEILGSVYVEAIIKFARKKVLPQEDRMAYFKRHDLFHLEMHSNCAHKGTNNGMTNCSACHATKPVGSGGKYLAPQCRDQSGKHQHQSMPKIKFQEIMVGFSHIRSCYRPM